MSTVTAPDPLGRTGLWLMALAVVLIPCSYATKFIIGRPEMTWINPSLLLSLTAMALLIFRRRWLLIPRVPLAWGGVFLLWTWISALVSGVATPGESLYEIFREPIRFALNFLFLFLIAYFAQYPGARQRLLRALMYAVILEFLIAMYFWIAFWHPLPMPDICRQYVREFNYRQAWWFGKFVLPRLGGSFIEGPPLGLFAISSLLAIIYFSNPYTRLSYLAMACAVLTIIGTFSTQIFLAMLVGLSGYLLSHVRMRMTRKQLGVTILILILAVSSYCFFSWQIQVKRDLAVASTTIHGTSLGERTWHIQYGWKLLQENPMILLGGVGLGRYGQWAAQTGLFPPSVTPQFLLIDVVVGTGVIGVIFWIGWMVQTARYGFRRLGIMGVTILLVLLLADMFQANWNWEIFYLTMALLITPTLPRPSRPAVGDHPLRKGTPSCSA